MPEAATRSTPWLVVLKPVAEPRLTLVCFPYAGGGPAVFRNWRRQVDDDVELAAVRLPGRLGRFGEPPHDRVEPLMDDAAVALAAALAEPYAFFGHSMGALLAYELSVRFRALGAPMPRVLVVSAHRAPSIPGPPPALRDLSDAEFLERARVFDGIPDLVLQNQDLLDLVLPTLRADMELCEAYAPRPEPPLSCPIVAVGGREDDAVPASSLDAWREHTSSTFELELLDGGHFFLHSAEEELLGLLRRVLERAGA